MFAYFSSLFTALALFAAGPANAQVDTSFDGYLQLVAAKARAQGISQRAIDQTLAGLTPNSRVIELDQAQPGTPSRPGVYPPMSSYIARHVDSARINGGRNTFARTRSISRAVEERYGVPGEIMIAIWGHETNYGSYKGDFDLARSLATLAWEGRRRDLFEGELIALMKMVDQGTQRSQLVGSWAGAFGNPQFLPSVFLRLAVDGNGDGRKDIWNSDADTLYSIGNYFRDAGWQAGLPWAVRASVPAGLDRTALKSPLVSPVCPRVHERHSQWKTLAEWRQLGVTPFRSLPDDTMLALFEPDGPNAPQYLLTGNYRVILEYNCSNYYAMSVGLLADEISR
jgi:lytic murein transglycosylase